VFDLITKIAPSCWPWRLAGSAMTTEEMHLVQILEMHSSSRLEVEGQSSPSEAVEQISDFMAVSDGDLLLSNFWRDWILKYAVDQERW
jgi:hypothetical protein